MGGGSCSAGSSSTLVGEARDDATLVLVELAQIEVGVEAGMHKARDLGLRHSGEGLNARVRRRSDELSGKAGAGWREKR